ncbi:predicted protein [Streptomyces filamentosus NRRL 15998]|uniref:Predicted protein n=1 Tax=Streptomyces filamentosus NRRL 15998 TaxID=457431 RepID=D6AUS0_STRFL|nr:predicted protein [Streptomyces filamentosus NRRL 15998]
MVRNLDEETDAPVEGMTRVFMHEGILPGGRETPIPRSERFCLGTLGGAGGTRTHGRRIMSPLL